MENQSLRAFRTLFAGLALVLSTSAFAEVSLKLESKGSVEQLHSKERVDLEAGQAFAWDGKEPVAVFQKDMLPIVVVPGDFKGDVNVKAMRIKDAYQEKVQELADAALSEILVGVTEIQKLSRKRHFKLAQDRYRLLRSQYPNVKFLDFIGASLSMLTGDRPGARVLATQGLKAHPDYEDGKVFVESLGASGE